MARGRWTDRSKEVEKVLTKDFLEKQNKIKTVKQIAVETGYSDSTIRKYSYKYGLKLYNSRKGIFAAENNPMWKGEETFANGRIWIYDRELKCRRRKHIYIMEQFIGRRLYKYEVVHHLNGNPLDNEIDNLILLTKVNHDRYHMIMRNKSNTKRKKPENYKYHTASKVIQVLNKNCTIKMKIYAELTRIIQV